MKNQYKDFKIMKIDNQLYKISYYFTNENHEYVLSNEVDTYICTKLNKKVLLPHSPFTVSYDSITWFAISIIFEDKEFKLYQEVFEKTITNIINENNEENQLFYQVMRDVLFIKYHFHFLSCQPIHFDKCTSFFYKMSKELDSNIVDLTQIFYQMNIKEEKKE
jgi:hypothetical protein